MKILNLKNLLIILVFIFIFINCIFLLEYFNFKSSDIRKEEPKLSAVEFLKKFVDFNHTAFESKGKIHFYYPVIQKLDSSQIINASYQSLSKIQKECEYFYDDANDIFVDSKFKLCNSRGFNYTTNCCTNILNDINLECSRNLKCCKREFECIFTCTGTWADCKETCRMNILTKFDVYKHCYITYEDLPLINYELIVSK